MGKYYSTYPVIKFFCECYHYIKVIRHHRHSRLTTTGNTSRKKVNSYKETYLFPYYSERDVSGLFYLECNSPEKKHYIQLDIDTEINFADAISYMDYQMQKDSFWRRNVFKDKYFNFQETRYIPGLEKENLVRIGDSDPCCASFFIYFIFIILTLGEFYKWYFNSLCVEQTYKIRKLVSTRYDLNQPIYNDFIPQVDVISRQQSYDEDHYNYLNNDYKLQLPTKEELEKAEKYKNLVPEYKVSLVRSKTKAGIVVDNPEIVTYEQNEPPEAFSLMKINVGRKKKKSVKEITSE